ncbi:hypothetical protein J3Q64DRAFT_1701819 [Phycomyces blakesleeanus]|uniref:UspA domain-containing protein n=2 Tax=Phycomyces blakesleeanus TaxID=4837 RepID=A0A162WLQ9_PHYB8|nr:hypothetical protein PHYBLDRAFT_67019 [Phycomyces blakesleeanus NRRL 1555(-)]OAD68915.1 hypothetical protein PHYBLDRAFT_67019 [Phycomyces blakesleeanus NRRL 1555(-)]|eukprot:XP_018286955.1 hypothetical protein PHYBLDRAFT_67019 [Phycomyces blakesleeanus NRRL 1555(-)]
MGTKDTNVDLSHTHDPEQEATKTRTAVISIDDHSDYVVEWALENFIRPETDMVVLIHVRHLDVPVAPYINPTGYIEDNDEVGRERSHRLLRGFAKELKKRNILCRAISIIGEPKTEILRKTREVKADVLIMGSRKLGTIKRTLLGSVSDHCVHHCTCSIIIASPKEAEEAPQKSHSFFSK